MPHSFDDLTRFAGDLLTAAGLEPSKVAVVARLLVTADAMGHTTHGLAQLAGYIDELERGTMLAAGEPGVISDRGAAVVWDGRRLPGVWLTAQALDLAVGRAERHGLCAVSIRRSHHIACLAAFLPAATDRGMMAIIASSDPSEAVVAPFGGACGVLTPDPIAVGIPTSGDPILIDMSSSITTMGLSGRLRRAGERFPGPWAIDAAGAATDDPAVLVATPPGALLLTGGLDHGHKGYGLALMVEALTQGLSGYGRADGENEWGASVFVQVFDPAAFAGLAALTRQTAFLAAQCLATPALDPAAPVRLPGAAAVAGLRAAMAGGLTLYPGILESLEGPAAKRSVPIPVGYGS